MADRSEPLKDSQRILDAIRRLVRLLRLADRAAQSRAGLSAAQLFVLSEIGKTPAVSLGELADRTVTDQSSVSAVVARLVESGLVSRLRAEDDARRLSLSITDKGRAALADAPPVTQDVLLNVLAGLNPRERKALADTLTRVVDAMGAERAAPMLFEDVPQRKGRRRE